MVRNDLCSDIMDGVLDPPDADYEGAMIPARRQYGLVESVVVGVIVLWIIIAAVGLAVYVFNQMQKRDERYELRDGMD